MAFRKLLATKIFDGYRFRPGEVLLVGENGQIEGFIPQSQAGEGVEKLEGTLSPAFINCHCHLELSHMKGLIPMGTGLVDFVCSVVSQRHFPDHQILDSIRGADEEMFANGIQAVGDICNNTFSISTKSGSSISYLNFIEASGWDPYMIPKRFPRLLEIYNSFLENIPRHPSFIVPHAPYSVSQELWSMITSYFENKTVSIHNQETKDENEFFQSGSGALNRMYEKMNIENSHHQPKWL